MFLFRTNIIQERLAQPKRVDPALFLFGTSIIQEQDSTKQTLKFDYQLIKDDVEGDETESDILEIFGREFYHKIKCTLLGETEAKSNSNSDSNDRHSTMTALRKKY